MRIGIDGRGLRLSLDGIGRYTKNLIRGILEFDQENEFVLFVLPGVDLEFIPPRDGLEIVVFPHHHLSLYTIFTFKDAVRRAGPDLLHIPFAIGPWTPPVPTIVTVHDLMSLTRPRFFSGRSLPGEIAAKAFHQVFVPRTVRGADVVFADSDATRREVMRVLGVPSNRIEVVYPFVEKHFQERIGPARIDAARRFVGVEDRYLLFYGNTKPYKNLDGLLRGYAELAGRLDDPPSLLILGPPDRFRPMVEAKARELDLGDRVIFRGDVPDPILVGLLKGAEALCFPSLEEGFGLPVLEAMIVGTPVVTSNVSSLPEVAGDAALLVDPQSPGEIADAIERVLTEPGLRASLVARGNGQAAKFRRKTIIRQILDTYQRVTGTKT